MFTLPYSLFFEGWHSRLLFSLHFSLPQKSVHSGELKLLSPLCLGLKRSPLPSWEKVFDWVISSDVLLLDSPDIPTLLLRFSGSRSSPDIFFAPSSLSISCSWTRGLITYQFFYRSLSLRSFAPTSVPLPSIFRKLAGMTLLFTLTLTVLLQRNTRFFLFPLLLLSSLLWH